MSLIKQWSHNDSMPWKVDHYGYGYAALRLCQCLTPQLSHPLICRFSMSFQQLNSNNTCWSLLFCTVLMYRQLLQKPLHFHGWQLPHEIVNLHICCSAMIIFCIKQSFSIAWLHPCLLLLPPTCSDEVTKIVWFELEEGAYPVCHKKFNYQKVAFTQLQLSCLLLSFLCPQCLTCHIVFSCFTCWFNYHTRLLPHCTCFVSLFSSLAAWSRPQFWFSFPCNLPCSFFSIYCNM